MKNYFEKFDSLLVINNEQAATIKGGITFVRTTAGCIPLKPKPNSKPIIFCPRSSTPVKPRSIRFF